MGAYIYTFAKTFTELSHAQAFVRGDIRMQTVRHFRELEDSKKALRGDAYEGIAAIWQPQHIKSIKIADFTLDSSALAGPIKMHRTDAMDWHVFCVHFIGAPDKSEPPELSDLDEVASYIGLDERCEGFGDHLVVFKDGKAFVDRMMAGIERAGYYGRAGTVKYFHELNYSGFFGEEVPFRKPRAYEYQKEYRFVAETPPGVSTPMTLNIGDLSDIAHICQSKGFSKQIKVSVNT